jgi:protein SCO1
MASSSRIALAALALAAAGASRAAAHPPEGQGVPAPRAARADAGDEIAPPPPTYQAGGVTVDEHLGALVPRDALFRTQDGALTTLGGALAGGLPAILTFNYSDCPMLCSVQLNGLTAALPKVGAPGPSPLAIAAAGAGGSRISATTAGDAQVVFRVGSQFRLVTIDLEPNETLDKARAMRERYLARIPEDQRAAARAGWTFLIAAVPGDPAAIRRVADAVGFRYTYVKDRAEWAHPAALILLSAAGVVTRYIYGIEYEPAMLRESIYKAGIAEAGAAVGFMLRCYHYDPDANSHARAGVTALQVGAAGFAILLFAALGVAHFSRRARRLIPAGPAAPNGVT